MFLVHGIFETCDHRYQKNAGGSASLDSSPRIAISEVVAWNVTPADYADYEVLSRAE